MSLLTIVQRFCRRTNLTVPATVHGSTDSQVLQIMALLEEEGNDLSGRGPWQELTHEATHTTVATESQGDITTIAPNNFRFIKNGTAWDRTENLPLLVIDGQDWQAEKGFAATAPRYRVRIRTGDLICTPTPTAGNTWAFEYVSWDWILDDDASTRKQYFTEDADTPLLPEEIILKGLRWRWKKEKGFDYAQDFEEYESMVADAVGREGIKKPLYMEDHTREPKPGIVVNQGNWSL